MKNINLIIQSIANKCIIYSKLYFFTIYNYNMKNIKKNKINNNKKFDILENELIKLTSDVNNLNLNKKFDNLENVNLNKENELIKLPNDVDNIDSNKKNEENKKNDNLENKLIELSNNVENINLNKKNIRGSNCSIEGKKYEYVVYNIAKKCYFDNDNMFNTQNIKELGGCSSKNDLICDWKNKMLIPIEIKKMNTPDWMQCSIKYNNELKKWIGSLNNKIPVESKKIFENLIDNLIIFNGKIPPFFEKNITHNEWKEIKNKTNDYNDSYIDCPNDTIKKLYSSKGCKYIQISELGLYHLGNDICNFEVPEFVCDQKIRIRTKIHSKCDKNGYCKLSVSISPKPTHIKNLIKSNYSLDDKNKIPKNLIYK